MESVRFDAYDKNGLVTLKDYGSVRIIVTTKDMGKKDYCYITVKEVSITDISLNDDNVTIMVNQQKILGVNILPENASNTNLIWTSSRPGIVSVKEGVITGNNIGTASITVKTKDGSKSASCTVTVVEPTSISVDTAEVDFDSTSDEAESEDGSKTITLYNNTDEEITNITASLKEGTAFDVEVDDSVAPNSNIVVKIIPKDNLDVGIYEDEITITSSENTIVIPVRYEVKASSGGTGDNPSGDNPSGDTPGGDQPSGGESGGTTPGGNEQGSSTPGGNEQGSSTPGGNEHGGSTPGGNEQGGSTPSGNEQGGNTPGGNVPGGNSGNNTSINPNPNAPTDQGGSSTGATDSTTTTESQNTTESKATVSKPSKVNIKSIKNSAKKTVTISWKKLSVKGYEVNIALNKKFTKGKSTKITTKTSLKIKKLKKGKTYYVRVRAYNLNGNKKVYGKWSAVKKVKIKK